jgi:hypothetical protein
VHFRAVVRQRTFSGSSEQLELGLDGQILRARVPARDSLRTEEEFWFSPADAVAVRE